MPSVSEASIWGHGCISFIFILGGLTPPPPPHPTPPPKIVDFVLFGQASGILARTTKAQAADGPLESLVWAVFGHVLDALICSEVTRLKCGCSVVPGLVLMHGCRRKQLLTYVIGKAAPARKLSICACCLLLRRKPV